MSKKIAATGERIRKAGRVNSVSVSEMARRVGVTRQTVDRWFRILETGNPLPEGRIEQLRAAVGIGGKK